MHSLLHAHPSGNWGGGKTGDGLSTGEGDVGGGDEGDNGGASGDTNGTEGGAEAAEDAGDGGGESKTTSQARRDIGIYSGKYGSMERW